MFDFTLNDDFDLEIADGDLVMGESTRQHQLLLLHTSPGEWRDSPLTGVGVQNYLLDEGDRAALMIEIKRQFEADGMVLDSLTGDILYQSEWAINTEGHYGNG